VGNRIVENSSANKSPYPFEFHLLRDTKTINAFALPGGQVFITAALVNAVGIAASDTPESGRQAAILAQAVNQMVNLKYGREDELESDRLGFRFMTEAGYNPKGIVELMQILGSSRTGQEPPEFFSTHPNPGNRIERLSEIIKQNFPNGIPGGLEEGEQKFAQIVGSRL
jgi:predicted Zn-dependent protease